MTNLALVVGVDSYDNINSLSGCEADASAIAKIIESNEDGSPNFDCKMMLSSRARVTRATLRENVVSLFSKEGVNIALFFFAGHGSLDAASGGQLVTQDGRQSDEGVSLSWLITQANESKAKERIVILDSCHSGAVDKLFASAQSIPVAPGVSILAACRDNEVAVEQGGRGLFSSSVCDALSGGGADVIGNVTAASIYAYVDEVLAGWDQRPLLKANLSKLEVVRKAAPAVSLERMRRITKFFPSADHKFQLDPSYEPTSLPNHPDHEADFGILQAYRAARIVVPDGEQHLYYAAMNSTSCSLTPLGRFYWRRVKARKI